MELAQIEVCFASEDYANSFFSLMDWNMKQVDWGMTVQPKPFTVAKGPGGRPQRRTVAFGQDAVAVSSRGGQWF